MVFPFSVIVGLFEFLADPVESVVGENTDKDVAIDAMFELMMVGTQTEGA